jgi:hypothetical protein
MDRLFVLALLLAHLTADFPLQTAWLCKLKYSGTPQEKSLGLSIHTIIHFVTALLVTMHFLWSPLLPVFLLLYALSHYVIDNVKTRFNAETLRSFFLDQFVHILVILNLTQYFQQNPAPWLDPFLSGLRFQNITGSELLTRILIVLILLILGVWATGIFIRIYIKRLKDNSYLKEAGVTDGGYLIGILERLFVITAIATNNASWASLILGVKSITRFQKFKENDAFVEYFLIGSFISLFAAFVIGLIIQRHLPVI